MTTHQCDASSNPRKGTGLISAREKMVWHDPLRGGLCVDVNFTGEDDIHSKRHTY